MQTLNTTPQGIENSIAEMKKEIEVLEIELNQETKAGNKLFCMRRLEVLKDQITQWERMLTLSKALEA